MTSQRHSLKRQAAACYKGKKWFLRFLNPQALPPKQLTQSIALEESRLPHILRLSVALIGAFMGIFLLWATLTDIEEVALASGEVVPSGYVQSVQHLEGGIVQEIYVQEGDVVERGDPLIRLDDTSAGADLNQMLARKKSLNLRAERLRKFAGAVSNGEALDEEEKAILNSMEVARERQKHVLTAQLTQKRDELNGLTAKRKALEKNVQITQKQHDIHRSLADKGYGSELMALNAAKDLNQTQGQMQEAQNQENSAIAAIDEADSRLKSLEADLKQQTMEELGTVDAELAELHETLEKYQHMAHRTLMISPVKGVVKGLNVHTLGAVVEPGSVLLELVPLDKAMMVEANINPADVGHLNPGQKVNIKISAYDFSRYGSIHGTLNQISATTFQTEDGGTFYKARIMLDQSHVGNNKGRNLILPGMTLEAGIITGEKSVLAFLLKPLHVAMDSAFSEY